MKGNPLTDKHRLELNKRLAQLLEIKEKIKLAKQAMIPESDELESRCDQCIKEVEALKRVYFPNKI